MQRGLMALTKEPAVDRAQVDAYLNRIGAAPVDQPDLQTLARLQYQHLRTVPFENLSIHLGEPIQLDEDALFEKVVERWRGGFCYELNGAFAMLLTALGYPVTYLAARVFSSKVPGPPLDHLALRVDLDRPYLVDVGFGALSNHPLLLDSRHEQHDPAGRFRLVDVESGEVDLLMNDKPQYRLELRPYELRDFIPMCWWQQTSPQSHFTRSLTCSRLTETGRVTLSGRKLIRTSDGRRELRTLTDEEILDAYASNFGITLDRAPSTPEHAVNRRYAARSA